MATPQDLLDFLNPVYDILVAQGGARETDRAEFLHHHRAGGYPEWRFIGYLGFGGKYLMEQNKVTCYPEDNTPERQALIDQINAQLAGLPNIPALA